MLGQLRIAMVGSGLYFLKCKFFRDMQCFLARQDSSFDRHTIIPSTRHLQKSKRFATKIPQKKYSVQPLPAACLYDLI